jgi:AraC-like DNA-binding protein
MVHGSVIGPDVVVGADPVAEEASRLAAGQYLRGKGIPPGSVRNCLGRMQAWSEAQCREAADYLGTVFFQISGWKPLLLEENRVKALQREQLTQAIEDQRGRGGRTLYAFEKERMLLAHIRAGDRSGAKRILNEMLAAIYLSSPQLVVLRARAIELISCLTRAAIEDNQLLEPLIDRNHTWTEQLIRATSFEGLSEDLMAALDDFIDGIYLHGANRSNAKVRMALDFVSRHYMDRISLREVAGAVGLSSCRLAHLVRELTGQTVLEIIHQVRVRQAQRMLERSSKSCAEIAYEVGFGDQSYFTKHFRAVVGTTPRRYRKSRAG